MLKLFVFALYLLGVYGTADKDNDLLGQFPNGTSIKNPNRIVYDEDGIYVPSANKIDCTGRDWTNYVLGCNNRYTICRYGKAFETFCPEEMYYNHVQRLCMAKRFIKECAIFERVHNILFKTPMPFDCKNKSNGSYGEPDKICTQRYYYCVGGQTVARRCLFDEYFDVSNATCQAIATSSVCGDNGIKTADNGIKNGENGIKISGHIGAKVETPDNKQNVQTRSDCDQNSGKTPVPDQEMTWPDCTKLPNGVYGDPNIRCSTYFYKCENGETFKGRCQKVGLFFNTDIKNCTLKESIPACRGA